jgi:hypothetical protein
MKTLTVPRDTPPPKFEVKIDQCFHLKFEKAGQISLQHADYFAPPLPKDEMPIDTVTTHATKKTGEVNFNFTATLSGGKRTFSAHTILIGS